MTKYIEFSEKEVGLLSTLLLILTIEYSIRKVHKGQEEFPLN
jgi:hypothetical protein